MLGKLQEQKLKRMFQYYDLDRDGVLKKEDFETLSKNYAKIRGWVPQDTEHSYLHDMLLNQWADLEKTADTDRDRKVTMIEWLQYWENILDSEQSYDIIVNGFGNAFFQLLDRNNDNKISYQEYQEFVAASDVNDFDIEDSFNKMSNNSSILTSEDAKQIRIDFFLKNEENAPGNWLFGPF